MNQLSLIQQQFLHLENHQNIRRMIFPQSTPYFYQYPSNDQSKSSFPGGIKPFQILLSQALRISLAAFAITFSPTKFDQTTPQQPNQPIIYQIQSLQQQLSVQISSAVQKLQPTKDDEKTQLEFVVHQDKIKQQNQTHPKTPSIQIQLQNLNEKIEEQDKISDGKSHIQEEIQHNTPLSYAKLPKFELSGSQILKKKQQLMKRQVQNWKTKVKKERVELRRIKN